MGCAASLKPPASSPGAPPNNGNSGGASYGAPASGQLVYGAPVYGAPVYGTPVYSGNEGRGGSAALLCRLECDGCGAEFRVAAPPAALASTDLRASCFRCRRQLHLHVAGGTPCLKKTSLSEEKIIDDVLEASRITHLLEGLPREYYSGCHHADYTECDLCMEDYQEGDELVRLPCMHLFHGHCVLPWLQKACTCPVCNTDAKFAAENSIWPWGLTDSAADNSVAATSASPASASLASASGDGHGTA